MTATLQAQKASLTTFPKSSLMGRTALTPQCILLSSIDKAANISASRALNLKISSVS